jgi:hypothetical protein
MRSGRIDQYCPRYHFQKEREHPKHTCTKMHELIRSPPFLLFAKTGNPYIDQPLIPDEGVHWFDYVKSASFYFVGKRQNLTIKTPALGQEFKPAGKFEKV